MYSLRMINPVFIPHHQWSPGISPEDAARNFHEVLSRRRSIRHFSEKTVSRETIEWLVRCASSAPSGANKQPWRFVCVQDKALKHRIREAAEAEERTFYNERATKEWKQDLAPFGTDEIKEYLDVAPWLIVVFRLAKNDDGSGVYYSDESVGIATGMLLAAAQMAGLATLPHTPNPMKFLGQVLDRPSSERAWMLIPVGWPADKCTVPEHALSRKPLDEIMVVH